ncbi:hypothetical protein CA54_37870 [Symmachiella macrocystis]|uniref:AsmA-like C-terminal domain-containing protein n=1 Tax=Symmachiella macrocystis TaxID=2527985 RepID=A0A5C6BT77_9PLAN|nr:hypothetical protein [Symmachiella macrocystis]TWU14917.1 hypothetical protein CA54_37870 [Symmachiella macrocystis]
MAAIRKTCTWIFVLLVFVVAGGGGYAYWFLSQSDELVRATLLEKLAAAAPDWQAEIPEARIDLWGRVRVYDLTLKNPENRRPAVLLPETIVVLDRSRLADQEVVIQQVRLLRPELELVRDRAGRWNLEGIQPPPESKSQPEIFVEQGAITLRVTHEDGQLSPAMTLRDVNLELTPTGKKRYRIKSDFQLDKAGAMQLNGEFDLVAKTWEANGAIQELQLDADLAKELAGFFPKQVRKLDEQTSQLLASKRDSLAAPDADQVAQLDDRKATDGFDAMADRILLAARLNAKTEITFQVKQWEQGAPVQYGAKIAISEGRLQSVFLPFELLDLGGNIFVNNTRINAQALTARNGSTNLTVDGNWAFQEADAPVKIDIAINDLPVDTRLRSRLPTSWKKYYDDTRPGGRIDVAAQLEYDRVNSWKHSSRVTIKDGTMQHVKFPYPVTDMNGWVIQDGPLLTANVNGMAGDRPITIAADVRHPGPLAESTIDIHVTGLPIDGKLINACSPPAQKAIHQLNLRGTIDADVTLYRPPGPGHKHQPHLKGKLLDGAVTCVQFPYELRDVNGLMEWDAEDWTFERMTATHGTTQVWGGGSFIKRDGGLLDMRLVAKNASFESEELYYALPEAMQQLTREFEPQGRFDIDSHIRWTPGTIPVVDIHQLDLKNDSIKLRSFPFPFHDVTGRVSVINNPDPNLNQRDIIITGLTAKHGDDKTIELRGSGEYYPHGEWHVSLDKLTIDDLDTGNRFRKALPNTLRAFFEATDPRGHNISANGRLALRGTPGPREMMVTAKWDIDIYHSGTSITAGVGLDDLFGRVNLNGEWNGEAIMGTGWLDLDSVTIDGYQLTDIAGPMYFQNEQFIIGSRAVASDEKAAVGPTAPDDQDRVTAKFIGGKLVLDGIATLDENNAYKIKIHIKEGRVERYTERYAPKQKQLRGVINGNVVFEGRGSDPNSFRGRGNISINPAALYELPVILQMTKALSFLPPDKTAFDRAFVKFESTKHEYFFQQIDLAGDAISLRGRGRMRQSDGALDLDFYSTQPRNKLPVPIVGNLAAGLTENWVYVKVTGTTSDPKINQSVIPRLDGLGRSLLGILGPQQPTQRPTNANRSRIQPRR